MQPLNKRLVTESAVPSHVATALTTAGASKTALENAIGTQIATPGTPAATALSATYALKGEAAPARSYAPIYTPSDQIATMLDFGTGRRVWALASDSTINDFNDWFPTWLQLLKAKMPAGVGIEHWPLNADKETWRGFPTVIKEGTTTAATGGVVVSDNFNRTTSTLVGSTTSGGQVWAGTAGTWTADGTLAHAISASSVALSCNTGSRDTKTTAILDIITATAGAAPQARTYVAADTANVATAPNAIWAQIAISTTGSPSLTVWKRIGGTSTQIVTTDTATGITANSGTAQKVTVTVEVAIQNITVTLTPSGGATKTYTATVTEAEYNALGTNSGFTFSGNTGDHHRLDNVTMETPYTAGTYSGLSVWNAGVAGTKLDYQQARIATLFNQPHIDVLVLAGGHNYTTATPEAFITALESFVTAYKAAHPESLILVSSQNPQFAPAGYGVPHAARQAAVREWAKKNGYEYIPAFETFRTQPDGGASLTNADGIHPTVPAVNTTTPSGATTWATVWDQMVDAQRIVGS